MNLFWIVGESSGDRHASHIISEMSRLKPDWSHSGMCGTEMFASGCEEVVNLSEAALMGLTEVIRHLPRLLKLREKLVDEIEKRSIDLVVLVDFPDFNLAVAKLLRKRFGKKVKILYYVSPQVWAWRKGRAKTIAELSDAMAVLFPFEKDIYKKYGLETVFCGHPLVGEVSKSDSIENLRKRFNLKDGQEAVAILPGSRKQEVERLLPVQLETIQFLRKFKGSEVVALIAKANTVDIELLEEISKNTQNVKIVDGSSHDVMSVSKVGLVKSGTSTVETAIIGTPFVVLYKISSLSFRIAKLLVKGVKYIAMVNVLAGREIVKERIQNDARPELLAKDLLNIWDGPVREETITNLKEVTASLGESGGNRRLAEWIVKRFGDNS